MLSKILATILRPLLLIGFLIILFATSCNDIYDQEKYQKPDWLDGKLYTQISELEDLSTFKRCIELTGYDTILDRTGSYTPAFVTGAIAISVALILIFLLKIPEKKDS